MNKKLTNEIILHIYNKLGLLKSDINNGYSLLDDKWLLFDKIIFEIDNEIEEKQSLWGCSLSINNYTINLITTTNLDNDIILILNFKEDKISCSYGVNLKKSLISLKLNNNNWTFCDVQIQANFLASMEQLKDIIGKWSFLYDKENCIDLIKNFIAYTEEIND